jgi:hypothetical protein
MDSQYVPPFVRDMLEQQNGTLVQTTNGPKIMVENDPAEFANLRRRQFNDVIVLTQYGYQLYPRMEMSRLPRDFFEVFQTPRDAGMCENSEPLQPGQPGGGDGSGWTPAPPQNGGRNPNRPGDDTGYRPNPPGGSTQPSQPNQSNGNNSAPGFRMP